MQAGKDWPQQSELPSKSFFFFSLLISSLLFLQLCHFFGYNESKVKQQEQCIEKTGQSKKSLPHPTPSMSSLSLGLSFVLPLFFFSYFYIAFVCV
jgi:hypothetical protein